MNKITSDIKLSKPINPGILFITLSLCKKTSNTITYLVCLLTLLSIYNVSIFAQEQLNFSQLSTKDGFSSDQATAIIQDKKGFIWVGTKNGLNKYDGYKCKQYYPDYNDSTTLTNRAITALLESSDSKIWIGTTSGLNCLNPENDKIRSFLITNKIISLAEDEDGNIWIGTDIGGLHCINPQTFQVQHFYQDFIVNDITAATSDKNLWLATTIGLIRFNHTLKQFSNYPKNKDNSTDSLHTSILAIDKDTHGNLWLGTKKKGLICVKIEADKNSLIVKNYDVKNTVNDEMQKAAIINQLLFDHSGNLWISSENNGLFMLSSSELTKKNNNAQFLSYQHQYLNESSISGNQIHCLFVDRSNILWVGSNKINTAPIYKNGIRFMETKKYTHPFYSYEAVTTIKNENSNIWTGIGNSLKLIKNQDNNYVQIQEVKKIEYSYNNSKFTGSSIQYIMPTKQNLWVGTENAGVIIYSKDNKTKINKNNFSFYNTKTRIPLSGNNIKTIVRSKLNPSIYWIGTNQNGVTRLVVHNHKIVSSRIFKAGKEPYAISNNNIKTIFEDQEGIVWIGTQNGLSAYDPKIDRTTNFFHSFKDTTSINDNIINCIFEDSGNNLWIGTGSGLNKKIKVNTSREGNKTMFKNFSSNEIIGNNIITNITEDNSGSLWIFPYKGIVRFNPQSERVIKVFNTGINITTTPNSAITNNENYIMAGTNRGILYFHPDSLYKTSVAPNTCITDILILNESIEKTNTKEKGKLASYTKQVNLSYKDKVLTVLFSAMDFTNPNNNNYAYFLDGYDKTWNNIGKRNSVTFTNIPSGKYTLYIRSANSDGRWSSNSATLDITVSPPLWKTTWAILFYIICIVFIFYLFNRYSLIRVKAKNKLELELAEGEKDRKLNELKALFFTDLTHEFRTPLTLIQGPAEAIKKTQSLPDAVYKQSELILNNSDKLLQLVNRLMDFRKIDNEKMTLHPENCNLTALIKNLSDSFKYVAKSKSLQFEVHIPTNEIIALLDGEKMEKIIYNLLSNAFKYTEREGKISLRLKRDYNKKLKEIILIEITDNGIGIPADEQDKVFERFYQTHQKQTNNTGGIGLYLAKKLTELQEGQIHLKSELNKGTCISVILPYKEVQKETLESRLSQKNNNLSDSIIQSDEVTLGAKVSDNNTDKQKFNILIIEDEPELNTFICSGLQNNYNITSCLNGKEGYEQAKSVQPDLIISDIMMPEMDGFELIKTLKQNIVTSHIPVIFLTAKSITSEQIKGLELGAIDYILKPFSMEALQHKIANTITFREYIYKRIKTEKILEPEEIELSSLDEKFLKDAVEAINNNLDNTAFDVEKFSEIIGLSSNQAYRKIKSLTGQTIKEFIRNQRLKTAASMLTQNKRSISEIIYMVGFSSPSYFSKCFKEYFDCTPKEYVARSKKQGA